MWLLVWDRTGVWWLSPWWAKIRVRTCWWCVPNDKCSLKLTVDFQPDNYLLWYIVIFFSIFWCWTDHSDPVFLFCNVRQGMVAKRMTRPVSHDDWVRPTQPCWNTLGHRKIFYFSIILFFFFNVQKKSLAHLVFGCGVRFCGVRFCGVRFCGASGCWLRMLGWALPPPPRWKRRWYRYDR